MQAVICEVKEEIDLLCKFSHILCFHEAYLNKKITYLSTHSKIFFIYLVEVNEDAILDIIV